MKETPLHGEHVRMGAKMVEFAGFHMPLYYTSIIEEHMAVRKAVGIFDVSHMGDVIVEGPDATDFISHMLPSDGYLTSDYQCRYSAFLNPQGRMKDDTIFTRLSEERYFLVPNAAKTGEIVEWLRANDEDFSVNVIDVSEGYACIAVQGPLAEKVVSAVVDGDITSMEFMHARLVALRGIEIPRNPLGGDKIFLSRTGYTGEDGFELVVPAKMATTLWRELLKEGEEYGIKPCGLGARDTLRMEKGFLLSGQDFNEDRTPLEAGISWIIDWDHEFIGKEPLLKQREEKNYDRFRGFIVEGKAIPRHGTPVYSGDERVGVITSGTKSPTLGVPIGLGYVRRKFSKVGMKVEVEIRGKRYPAEVRKPRLVT